MGNFSRLVTHGNGGVQARPFQSVSWRLASIAGPLWKCKILWTEPDRVTSTAPVQRDV